MAHSILMVFPKFIASGRYVYFAIAALLFARIVKTKPVSICCSVYSRDQPHLWHACWLDDPSLDFASSAPHTGHTTYRLSSFFLSTLFNSNPPENMDVFLYLLMGSVSMHFHYYGVAAAFALLAKTVSCSIVNIGSFVTLTKSSALVLWWHLSHSNHPSVSSKYRSLLTVPHTGHFISYVFMSFSLSGCRHGISKISIV